MPVMRRRGLGSWRGRGMRRPARGVLAFRRLLGRRRAPATHRAGGIVGVDHGDEGGGELGAVTALLAVQPCAFLVASARCSRRSRLTPVRGLRREQVGAKKPGSTIVVLTPNSPASVARDSIQPLTPSFAAA
jgi:hypothetical protein